MKFLINSNKLYAPISLKRIIPSLIDCGIKSEDILVIIGGCEDVSGNFFNAGLFQCFNTRINAIDQTAFYVFNRNQNIFNDDLYFYLQDTTYVGKEFKKNIDLLVKKNGIEAFKCFNGKSSNIGLYTRQGLINFFKKDTLYSYYEKILCDTFSPNDTNNLKYKKQISFKLEDHIFKNIPTIPICQKKQLLGKFDIYGTGNDRVLFYFKELDLYKANANTSDKVNGTPTFLGCKI